MRAWVIVTVVGLQLAAVPSHGPGGQEVWVTRTIRWQRAPAAVHAELTYGQGTVLYFGADRKFGMIDCWLYKKGDSLQISPGDGQNVYVGVWSERDGEISLTYRLTYRTVPVVGENLPGPSQTSKTRLGHKQRLTGKVDSHLQIILRDSAFVPAGYITREDVLSYLRPWYRPE